MSQTLLPATSPEPLLLLTRPRERSERFAESCALRLGPLRCIISPLMRTEFPPVSSEGLAKLAAADLLILTSEAAVTAAASLADHRPQVLCVGSATARAARLAGFSVALAEATAALLVEALATAAHLQPRPCLHLRGQHVAAPLASMLRSRGWQAEELVVYEQRARPLSPEARDGLAAPGRVILPLFSARSARLAAAALEEAFGMPLPGRVEIAAMSGAVAEAAEPLAPQRLELATSPGASGMLDAVQRLIDAGKE